MIPNNPKIVIQNSGKGQSLFEVILSLAIITTIIVGIVSLALVSVNNSTFANEKALATRYNQEALEWLRSEENQNYDAFLANVQTFPTICLPTLAWGNGGTCTSGEEIGTTSFKREALFSYDATSVNVTVRVYWPGSNGKLNEVRNSTIFTKWQQ